MAFHLIIYLPSKRKWPDWIASGFGLAGVVAVVVDLVGRRVPNCDFGLPHRTALELKGRKWFGAWAAAGISRHWGCWWRMQLEGRLQNGQKDIYPHWWTRITRACNRKYYFLLHLSLSTFQKFGVPIPFPIPTAIISPQNL